MSGIPLYPDRKFMSLTRVWGVLGEQTVALHAPRQCHFETKQSTYSKYTPEERVKMERYGAENGLPNTSPCI